MNQTNPAGSPPSSKNVIALLEYYLVTKAPFQIPDNWREWIVKWAPWIQVVLLVLLLPLILFALGLGTLVLPFMGTKVVGGFFGIILLLAQTALMAAAIPGLFKRSMTGWNLAFYGQIVTVLSNLVHVDILSGLIGALLSFYVLFQVRSYYK